MLRGDSVDVEVACCCQDRNDVDVVFASSQVKWRETSLVGSVGVHVLLVDKELDQVEEPLFRGNMQHGATVRVASHAYIEAFDFRQRFHNVGMLFGDRELYRRQAVCIDKVHVDVGRRQQKFDDVGVAFAGGEMQGRRPSRGDAVDVDSVWLCQHQRLDALEVAFVGGIVQWESRGSL